jgi:Ni,Fe-hydrogenase I cytochrome b subunit
MEPYDWISRNKTEWAVSILRVSYYLTSILTVLFFVTPFYAGFVYLWPHAAHLLTGSASLYVAIIAVIYGISFMVLTSVLIVLHGLAERYLSKAKNPEEVNQNFIKGDSDLSE